MDNQSGHPGQLSMIGQGFRPAPATAQQHAGSSSITPSIQMPVLPSSRQENGSICVADDGYSWRKYGQQAIPGWGCPTIYYQCAQANCRVKKSVALSADAQQIVETVFRGTHNHPRPSETWPRDGLAGYEPASQHYVLPEVSAAGTSKPRDAQGDVQLPVPSSSDSSENNDGEARADGNISSDANAVERRVSAPAPTITAEWIDGCSQQSGSSRQSKRKKSKSKVWEEFTPVLYGGQIQSAECKHCKKCLSGKSSGGTSHLRRHLKICPALTATGRAQQQQSFPHPDTSAARNLTFDQDRSIGLLTRPLVPNYACPFSLTSSTDFRQYLAAISHTYDMVSQGATREKFLNFFQSEKLNLKEEIALAPGGVFLAVTTWDLENRCFICVAVHFIDKEWIMNRKIIRCTFLGCDYTEAECYVSMFPDWQSCSKMVTGSMKEAAEEIVKEVVQSWNLECKLLAVLFPEWLGDTAISNLEKNLTLTEQNYLVAKCKLLTLHCTIHDLRHFFDYDLSEFVLTTSRSWFEYMTCSHLRRDKYKEILSQLQIKRPSFCSLNWHLTFYLLEAALQFNKALPNPEQIDSQFDPSKPSCTEAENFCDLVRPIYNAIKVISSNTTLNSHFHAIWNLKMALLNSSRKENINDVLDIQRMHEKFDKLWKKWYMWLSLAVVLDPRYKIRFIEICFKQAFGNDAKRYIHEVRGKIYELFFRYSFHADQQSGELLNDCNNDLELDAHGSVPVHGTSQDYVKQSGREEVRELIRYFEEELVAENAPLDILKWWKDNASTYPTVSRLARDILAIPSCAVSSESAFEETDERVSLFRRILSPEVVEALICTQDWIKSSEINYQAGGSRNMPA